MGDDKTEDNKKKADEKNASVPTVNTYSAGRVCVQIHRM